MSDLRRGTQCAVGDGWRLAKWLPYTANVYAKRRGHMGSPAWPPRKLPRVRLSILLGRDASVELNAQSSSDL